MCPLDGGAIEQNQLLYAFGYIKPIYSDNPDVEGGIAATEIGPINEWYIGGFDGGEKALIGFATSFCDYYLLAGVPMFIAQVRSLWQDKSGEKYFHAKWFCRGSDTVFGETCDDATELVVLNDCEDCLLSAVVNRVQVTFRNADPAEWRKLGGSEEAVVQPEEDDGRKFWYQFYYDNRYETEAIIGKWTA